jgi:hypothetical protein
MIIPLRKRLPIAAAEVGGELDASKESAPNRFLPRLVQITLALYLLPALLIVLVVGSVGMLVLGTVGLVGQLRSAPAFQSATNARGTMVDAQTSLSDRV